MNIQGHMLVLEKMANLLAPSAQWTQPGQGGGCATHNALSSPHCSQGTGW